MVVLVSAQFVVVATHLNQFECPWRVLVPRHPLRLTVPVVVHGKGCWACCVLMLDGNCYGIGNLLAARYVRTLGYLVAYAPHDDGWVITVAAHHQRSIIFEIGDAGAHGFAIGEDLLFL